jgi:hypothetical protein
MLIFGQIVDVNYDIKVKMMHGHLSFVRDDDRPSIGEKG